MGPPCPAPDRPRLGFESLLRRPECLGHERGLGGRRASVPGGASGPGFSVPGPAAPSRAGRGDLSELRAAASGAESKRGRLRYLGDPGPSPLLDLSSQWPPLPKAPTQEPQDLRSLAWSHSLGQSPGSPPAGRDPKRTREERTLLPPGH